ncbi:MAG TPA: hypothetical protein VG253_09040 [Streptosporangiaceae bacterium]|jgi:hypothetical protein|nr:hypothetical protein [Streptosporangiaceae bacterium]
MADRLTYYALLLDDDSKADPSGLARRGTSRDGQVRDEALQRDLSWALTPLIAGSDRGDMTFELVEVSEEEAERIIARFREKWAT